MGDRGLGRTIERYYPEYRKSETVISDFDLTMREVRPRVDGRLAGGEIEKAEANMKEQRILLVYQGYNVRNSNQSSPTCRDDSPSRIRNFTQFL